MLGESSYSYAQTPDIPGSADTSRIPQRLQIPETSEAQDIIAPEDMVIDENIPDNPDGFILEAIEIKGVTAFGENYFDSLIREYIGQSVDLTTLNHLADRITKIYRDNGYFLSRAIVPEQEVNEGAVIIQVIEGRVGKVTTQDPDRLLKNDHLRIIERTIRKIERIDPLHGPTLERYVLLLNEHMGVTVQNILQAPQGQTEMGNVDIVLRVLSNEPHQARFNYNNYGSRFVGPHQFTASTTHNGVFNIFDSLTIQGSTALPMTEVQFGSVSYSMPLNEEGLTASITAGYSNSEPGFSLKELEVEGDSTSISANLTYPFYKKRRASLILGTGFELRNSATEFLDQELIDDKIRSASLFANYSALDPFGGSNSVNVSVTKGLDILGATKTGTNNLSREQGVSDFMKWSANLSRQQDLGKGFRVVNAVSAQYAPEPLLSSEEFGYGGIAFGRAYDPSEITGDSGVATSIELLYTDLDIIPNLNIRLVPFAFYDIGKVWDQDIGTKPISAASAGAGSYFNVNNQFNGQMQIAYPLTNPVSTPIMNGGNSPRMLFSLNATF